MKRSIRQLNVRAALGAILPFVLLPAPANAHLMNTGLGPFYDGAVHLFVTPEQLLPVVALTLLSGLRGPNCGRAVLWMLPAAWLVASLVALRLPPFMPPAVTAAMTIALGALVAADAPLPLALVAALAITLGLLDGMVSGIELAKLRASDVGISAAGVACVLFVVVSLLAGQVASLRAQWARLVVRVAGSWIGAIGLLLLGWSLRPGV